MRKSKNWYISGLSFECLSCGHCCQGPEEGYIWADEKELKMMADLLGISVEQLECDYTEQVNNKRTILENPVNNDCIFLQGRKSCEIYPVRPNQCRTWPFWGINLENQDSWNHAAQRCPGINRGRIYTFDEIEKIRTQQCWWQGKDCGPKK